MFMRQEVGFISFAICNISAQRCSDWIRRMTPSPMYVLRRSRVLSVYLCIIGWCSVSVLRGWVGAPPQQFDTHNSCFMNAKSGGGCSARSPLTAEPVEIALTQGEACIALSLRDEAGFPPAARLSVF